MLLDARDPTVRLSRNAQVLIVGAGLAGLTLAHELAGIAEVLIVESGGLVESPAIDALNAGEVVGLPYPLQETRTRRVGGSLSLWAGWLAPFDCHDFSSRECDGHRGWPFGFDVLESYYAKAARRLNLADWNFDARDLAGGCDIPLPLDDGIIRPTAWRFGTPTLRFEDSDRASLESSKNPTLLTHATAVELTLRRERDSIDGVKIRTLDGREGRLSADVVVLASGGLETARLLLNSNSSNPAGLGNSSGLLGRCFMEHPHLTFESLLVLRPDLFAGSLQPTCDRYGRKFMINFGLMPRIQQDEQILNARVHVFRTPQMSCDAPPKVGMFMEQAPNPSSRIMLSDQRDPLGMRKLILDWRLGDLEWSTYRRTQEFFIDAFEAIGAGRRVPGTSEQLDTPRVLHSNHHLGTTRMSVRSDDGVVNPQCRVHDIENLYLIGGNVFPTVSWANPTLTLTSLTFRLADHLRSRWDAQPDPANKQPARSAV